MLHLNFKQSRSIIFTKDESGIYKGNIYDSVTCEDSSCSEFPIDLHILPFRNIDLSTQVRLKS